MKKSFFDVHTILQSNTEYCYNGETHIYLADTQKAESPKYFCLDGDPRGTGYLNTAFYLYGLKNVTLDFGGAILILHGRIQPFILDKCENVTIKNVSVGYARPLFTEMQVLQNTGTELVTTIDPIFTCRVENGYFIPYAEEWEERNLHISKCMFLQAFDSVTCAGKGALVIYLGEEIVEEENPSVQNIQHVKVRFADGKYTFYGKFPENWGENTTVVLEHESREKTNCAFYHCKNVVIENYRILDGCGMGFLGVCTENITFRDVKLFRDEVSKTLVTNPADAIHLVTCKGTVSVTDSVFEGMIDDGLNIHGNYWHTVSGEGNTLHIRRASITNGLGSDTESFGIGDVIAVYRGRTLEEKARFTVKDWKKTGMWTMDLLVDGNTELMDDEDIVENISCNAKLVIRNCRFANANSHLRLQTRGGILVENCEFGIPVWLSGDMNYWFESSPVEDIIIRNCSFCTKYRHMKIRPEFTPTEKAPYYHRNVLLENCSFSDREEMMICHTENFVLKNVTTGSGNKLNLITENSNVEYL